MRIHKIFAPWLVALALAGACGDKQKPDTLGPPGGGGGAALYDRLGGKDAIAVVVDKFIANVVADARISAFFANADPADLKAKLVDQICQATGGPCTYTGKNMKEAHAGMGVKAADFDALVEDLVKALDDAGVKEADKQELLGALGGMRGDIVAE